MAVVFLRIKTIEQIIALKQSKSTPRSMAVQLLLNLSKKLTNYPGEPVRKVVCWSISLEKIGFILYTRVWNHKTLIKVYCRLNQAIINGGRNACYQGIAFTVSFCEHSHTFVKIDEFVMRHPCRNGITSYLHALLKILHVTTWAYNTSLLDHCLGRTLLELITNFATIAEPQPPLIPTPAEPYFHVY